jgi:hypothetical protein
MTEFRNSGRYLAPALVACAVAGAAGAGELTIDRLFDAPALAGPTIVGLKISPDGSRVTYLQGKPDDKDRLDLWEYNIHDKVARVLVDSRALTPGSLSAEEISRRERQRTAALSGIRICCRHRSFPSIPRVSSPIRPSLRTEPRWRMCAIKISTPMTLPQRPSPQ